MKLIKLNNYIDNYEKSIEQLQFKFALSFYGWKKCRKKNAIILFKKKCKYFQAIFLNMLQGVIFIFVGSLFGFFLGYAIGGLIIGLLSAVVYCILYYLKIKKFYKNLPRLPISILDIEKEILIIKRNMPCVQIETSILKINFNDIIYASWQQSLNVKNGMDIISFMPLMRNGLNCYVSAFYLHIAEKKEIKKRLIFAGQSLSSNIYQEIFKKCNIYFR